MAFKNIEDSATYKNLCQEIEEMNSIVKESDHPELDERMKKACELIRKLNDEFQRDS